MSIPKGKMMCALFHLFLWQRPPNDPINIPTIICAKRRGRGDIPIGLSKPKIR